MPRLSHATVVAYAALFVALGGSAYAIGSVSAPASGVIAACYSKRSGDLRVLTSGRCHHGEHRLVWNKRGAPGPTGPQGPAGTVDTSNFYTKAESDGRYLGTTSTAADSSKLGGQPASAYAPSSLFGGGVTSTAATISSGSCALGEVALMANVTELPTNWVVANGQAVSVSQNTALFSLLGYTYGGSGQAFNLPSLQAADPKGTGPAAPQYVICVLGTFP
jgi:tail collar domain